MNKNNTNAAISGNGKEFFKKEEIIKRFHKSVFNANDNFTLVTGANNANKRDAIKNMLINSCSKNPTIFVDTRGLMDDDSLDLISSHRLVVGEVKRNDIYIDGLPVNMFAMDPNKSKEENAVDLFDTGSSIYSAPDTAHIDTLASMMSSYVDEVEVPTDCTISEAARTAKMQFFDTLIAAEINTVNDPFLYELHCSIDSDLDDCKVLNNSWGDIINPQLSLYYTIFNSGARDSAIPLANMMLASLRNYRKRNHETPIDLYINDITDLNFSCTGAIRKIINEAERLNINVIGISADYHMPSTPEGEMMSSACKQYFLFPTLSSKNYVNAALHITSNDSWPFKDISGYGTFDGAILKEVVQDKRTGKSKTTVFKGDFRNYFSLDEYFHLK